MIFQHTSEWIFGVSPHTGEPKTQTSRLKKSLEQLGELPTGEICVEKWQRYRVWLPKWVVGRNYAVQPGRSLKGIGKFRILHIEEGDARTITPEQARAEGFASPTHFLQLWHLMHDKAARPPDTVSEDYVPYLKTRPARFYDRWIITFEAEKAADIITPPMW